MFLVALPVLIAFMGLVIDGAHAFGEKRRSQNAADAAALAASQNILGNLNGPCPNGLTIITSVETAAECYSIVNHGPGDLEACNDPDPANPSRPAAGHGCYAYPYVDKSGVVHNDRVEVRITRVVDGFFLDAIGLGSVFDDGAYSRAVASVQALVGPPTTSTTTVTGTTNPGTTITNPGSTSVQTVTIPGDLGGAQAFVMSPHCSAIQYSGNPKYAETGAHLTSLATNGGLVFGSAGNKKVVERLGFNASGCPRPGGEKSGADCLSPSNGDSCIVERVALTPPQYWPVLPPPLPAPLPAGTVWDPATHYGVNCILLTPSGSGFVLPTTPGVYCVTGNVTLTITNSMTAGDGFTFYGLNGARLAVASNGTSVKFYWPSECGARPTTRSGFTCYGRAIADPLTVLYSTNSVPQSFTNPQCSTSAVCLSGSGGSLDGDVFAPLPSNFPPTPNQGGGTVYIAGGGAQAGTGFIEAWQLVIEGNSGTYFGNGPVGGGGFATITSTSPGSTVTVTGTTNPGTTSTTTTPGSTTGTVPGLDE